MTRPHIEVGLPIPIHQDLVAQEPVSVKDVEKELAVPIPSLVGNHQLDIVVAVAPVQSRAAR